MQDSLINLHLQVFLIYQRATSGDITGGFSPPPSSGRCSSDGGSMFLRCKSVNKASQATRLCLGFSDSAIIWTPWKKTVSELWLIMTLVCRQGLLFRGLGGRKRSMETSIINTTMHSSSPILFAGQPPSSLTHCIFSLCFFKPSFQ